MLPTKYAATSQLHVQKNNVIKNIAPSSLVLIMIMKDQGSITYAMPTIVAPIFCRAKLSPDIWRRIASKKSEINTIKDIAHKIDVRLISKEEPKRIKAPAAIVSQGICHVW